MAQAAQYGVVSQLLALVQWRAQAHTCVTGNCHDNAETAASHWVTASLSVLPGFLTALARTPDWLTVTLTKAGHY